MSFGYRWRPSASARHEFAEKMAEIEAFCAKNNISKSHNCDSYYFFIDGKRYRVSNHSREASNEAAFDEFTREQKRGVYHDLNDKEEIQILAGKTRLIEIYNNIKAGAKIDSRGRVIG